MPRIMLLGPPGSGKGTQAAKITHEYGIPVISTGDALRAQLGAATEIGLKAKSYMEAGKLVPDDIIIQLFKEMLESIDTKSGYLLDGFPRTIAQAVALDELLAERGESLDVVFFLKVPDHVLVKRISNRRICAACGLNYNMNGRRAVVDEFCDRCGTALVQREDDEPRTVKKRIRVYDEQTKPLIKYYRKQGILIELDGTLDVDRLEKQVDEALETAEEAV